MDKIKVAFQNAYRFQLLHKRRLAIRSNEGSSTRGPAEGTPDEEFSEVLDLTTKAIEILKGIEGVRRPDLVAFIDEICSISGLLYQLKKLSEHSALQDHWIEIVQVLREETGTFHTLRTSLEQVLSFYPPEKGRRADVDGPEPSQVKATLERQKKVFAYALLNEPSSLSDFATRFASPVSFSRMTRRYYPNIPSWISDCDYSVEYNAAMGYADPATVEWVIRSSQFEEWIKGGLDILWLCTNARNDKTVLCASFFKHLRTSHGATDGLAYFHFDSSNNSSGDLTTCLHSLIAQLLRNPENIPDLTQKLLCQYTVMPELDALKRILLSIVKNQRRNFIMLDALDKGLGMPEILGTFSWIGKLSSNGLHLLFSSQLHPEIKKWSEANRAYRVDVEDQSLTSIQKTADREEKVGEWNDTLNEKTEAAISGRSKPSIQDIVRKDEKIRKWNEALDRKVEVAITERSELGPPWIDCCLEMFRRCTSLDEVTAMIENMPRSTTDCYDRLLSKIPQHNTAQARNLFQWLAFAERPLYLEEAAAVTVVHFGRQHCLELRGALPRADELDAICLGLVTIDLNVGSDSNRSQIRFRNDDVKRHLLNISPESDLAARFTMSESDSQLLICHTILSCLSSSTETKMNPVEKLVKHSLLEYAASYWLKHINAVNGPIPSEIISLVVNLFDTRRNESLLKADANSSASEPEGPHAICQNGLRFPPPLYYATLLGIADVVFHLLERKDDLENGEGFCGTPLQAAAYTGNLGLVTRILESGADVNAGSGNNGSALQNALMYPHDEIVILLLRCGADPNIGWGLHGDALQTAVVQGDEELVQTLLEYGADPNAIHDDYGSSLFTAAQAGHKNIVKVLVDNGADVNKCGAGVSHSALYAASSSGHSEVVKWLLDKGANPSIKAGESSAILQVAVSEGHSEVVEVLLANRAMDGVQEALHLAIQSGRQDIVNMLHQHDSSDTDLTDDEGPSPLPHATISSYSESFQPFLNREPDVEIHDTGRKSGYRGQGKA